MGFKQLVHSKQRAVGDVAPNLIERWPTCMNLRELNLHAVGARGHATLTVAVMALLIRFSWRRKSGVSNGCFSLQ